MIFNDASGCYQNWLSCASCHPNMRSDGLNWDLGNDGYGSPRQAKSLLKAHSTAPTTITGCRPNAETSVRAGFKYIEFVIKSEEDSASVDTYLKSVKAVPSPYLVKGQLSESANRGKPLFQNRCGSCHSGEFYTDMNQYDVGTGRTQGELLDTPTLVEVWRTAPYLQDGRAATIMDVLTTYNANDQHGQTADLNETQLKDLEAFILTIGSSVTAVDTHDLKEAVNILQILAGINVQNISLSGDVDGDSKISLAEAVYIIRKISGLKQ